VSHFLDQYATGLEMTGEAYGSELDREVQAARQKRRGMGKLLGAVSRATSMFGSPEIAKTMNDAMAANATASDLADAARDLGISDGEIDEREDSG